MQESPSPNKAIVAVIIIVLLAAITAGTVYVMNSRDVENESTSSLNSSTTDVPATISDDAVASTYKDGAYSATGSYTSPGGQEEVKVDLTLANNVITDVSVTTDAASGTSSQYQSEFKSNYKTLVIGKNINEVKLSRVAGSSLTSTGFNDALEQIKTDAA